MAAFRVSVERFIQALTYPSRTADRMERCFLQNDRGKHNCSTVREAVVPAAGWDGDGKLNKAIDSASVQAGTAHLSERKIAERFFGKGSRYTEIVKLNGRGSNVLMSGQVLHIPEK